MARNHPASPRDEPRVIRFRRRETGGLGLSPPSPVEGLAKYERSDDPDDYRHRMLVNAAVLVVVVLLMAAGLWLADTMSALRKNEDCVFSGRRNCAPVTINHDRR